ncbi:NAD(P)/FAD-dependent oxidoreductase [Rhodalgimonas zhirmunskyi]|uniref:FAD-binding oxidoreductase n=1 Tax=Rhodalgimonas zhirmunskyi TaxID=2964767 RepID=A0AAJ1UDY1_9RHOB|nr:FAD-binding oxidoreductase [Rhodoalgimonas zhirmunskyi]MDQ2094556.1 FAD-binding oxidoreductase [Rhodoalgimonas zhirmunskyi]
MSSEQIYWQADDTDEIATANAPDRADVAVIGAGYTGLSTALNLARAGRHVVVFDAGGIGAGCSSRNGGMVGPSFHKLGSAGLIARYGEDKTLAIMREGVHALDYFEEFVAQNALDCDLQMRGRFRGARTVADYDAMARETDWLSRNIGLQVSMIERAEQHSEIGSDFYVGGAVYQRDGGIHPRKLVIALAQAARAAGVQIVTNCPVSNMRRDGGATTLQTPLGNVTAKEVVVATNAYADRRTPAMRNRIVPIRTAAVATEELSPQLMDSLTPKKRMFGESGRIFMWFRPSPDGRRFIFGGRIGRPGGPIEAQQKAFGQSVRRVFPQLSDVNFSHVWSGNVAYTPDHSPHVCFEDGVWLAGGYCGSGVTRSVYFGMKLARKILQEPGGETAFDDLPFQPVPFKPFSGRAASLLTKWYAHLDAQDLRRDRGKG